RRNGRRRGLPFHQPVSEPFEPFPDCLATGGLTLGSKVISKFLPAQDDWPAEEVRNHIEVHLASEYKDANALPSRCHGDVQMELIAETAFDFRLGESIGQRVRQHARLGEFRRLKRMQQLQRGITSALTLNLPHLHNREYDSDADGNGLDELKPY